MERERKRYISFLQINNCCGKRGYFLALSIDTILRRWERMPLFGAERRDKELDMSRKSKIVWTFWFAASERVLRVYDVGFESIYSLARLSLTHHAWGDARICVRRKELVLFNMATTTETSNAVQATKKKHLGIPEAIFVVRKNKIAYIILLANYSMRLPSE